MDKKTKLYTDAKSFILESIANKKDVKESAVINLLQDDLHDILYSYINGGFSKIGFMFYPMVKDLSKKNMEKIDNLRILAVFLKGRGHDFDDTLSLFEKKELDGKTAPLFISSFYRDFFNIKKPKIKNKKVNCSKLDFNKYDKKDKAYLEPVLELNNFARNELREYLLGLYIHGSIATRDYVRVWSDLDTLIIISKSTLNDPRKLVKLRDLLYKSKKYLYKVDPLQHHGHMTITEYDIEYYCNTFFPIELFKYSKSVFGRNILNFKIRGNKAENIGSFYSFVDYFKNLYLNKKLGIRSYEMKVFFHMVTLFPTMYLQAKGINVYKKFSFNLARKDFDKSLWSPIDTVSGIRMKWKTPNNIPLINLISNVNPLLAYQINSRYWDVFNKINKLNHFNIKKLIIDMHTLSENAWNKIKI